MRKTTTPPCASNIVMAYNSHSMGDPAHDDYGEDDGGIALPPLFDMIELPLFEGSAPSHSSSPSEATVTASGNGAEEVLVHFDSPAVVPTGLPAVTNGGASDGDPCALFLTFTSDSPALSDTPDSGAPSSRSSSSLPQSLAPSSPPPSCSPLLLSPSYGDSLALLGADLLPLPDDLLFSTWPAPVPLEPPLTKAHQEVTRTGPCGRVLAAPSADLTPVVERSRGTTPIRKEDVDGAKRRTRQGSCREAGCGKKGSRTRSTADAQACQQNWEQIMQAMHLADGRSLKGKWYWHLRGASISRGIHSFSPYSALSSI